MSRKFVGFDVETAKEFPGEDWRRHRPLGITCAATLCTGALPPTRFYGTNPDESPADQMSRDDARKLVAHLCDLVSQGYTIVTWNGLGFDFDILGEESGELARCRQLTWNHVDMMFQVVCEKGYRVSLAKAAQALGVPGKSLEGHDAPRLWRDGQHAAVLDYVAQDVWIALQVAEKSEQRGAFQWVTQKGRIAHMPIPDGWNTVKECEQFPLPDTSWIGSPVERRTCTGWLYDPPTKLRGPHTSRSAPVRR